MNQAIPKMAVETVIPGPAASSGKTKIPAPTVLPVIISDADPTGMRKFCRNVLIDSDDGTDDSAEGGKNEDIDLTSVVVPHCDGEKSTGLAIATALVLLVAAKSFPRRNDRWCCTSSWF